MHNYDKKYGKILSNQCVSELYSIKQPRPDETLPFVKISVPYYAVCPKLNLTPLSLPQWGIMHGSMHTGAFQVFV